LEASSKFSVSTIAAFLIFTWEYAKMPQNKLRKEETTENRRLPKRISAYKVKSNSSRLVDQILLNQVVKQLRTAIAN